MSERADVCTRILLIPRNFPRDIYSSKRRLVASGNRIENPGPGSVQSKIKSVFVERTIFPRPRWKNERHSGGLNPRWETI